MQHGITFRAIHRDECQSNSVCCISPSTRNRSVEAKWEFSVRLHCIRIHLSIHYYRIKQSTAIDHSTKARAAHRNCKLVQRTNAEHIPCVDLNCRMKWSDVGGNGQRCKMIIKNRKIAHAKEKQKNKTESEQRTATSRQRGACSWWCWCPNAKLLWFEFLKSQWNHYTQLLNKIE